MARIAALNLADSLYVGRGHDPKCHGAVAYVDMTVLAPGNHVRLTGGVAVDE